MKWIAKICTVMLMTSIILVACGPPATETPVDEVTLQLKWFHQSQFAGFYAAAQNGYYAEENLNVTILEGGSSVDFKEIVLSGEAQFGVAGGDELIVARSEGKPIQAVGTIYRRTPRVFVAKADSGINGPTDFVGQNIHVTSSGLPTLRAVMARVGISPDQYNTVSGPQDVELFASDEVPIWSVYLTGSIRVLEEAGFELNIIYPDDYGVHFYADTIFATDDFINENPDLVLRFLRASLRGWRWAVENPVEAGSLASEYKAELDPLIQITQMEASIPLVHTGEDQIGWMRDDVWEGMHQTLLEQGVIKKSVELDEVYSMEFLSTIYGEE